MLFEINKRFIDFSFVFVVDVVVIVVKVEHNYYNTLEK